MSDTVDADGGGGGGRVPSLKLRLLGSRSEEWCISFM